MHTRHAGPCRSATHHRAPDYADATATLASRARAQRHAGERRRNHRARELMPRASELHVAVVGAGPYGLEAAAWTIARGTVRADRPCGRARTVRADGSRLHPRGRYKRRAFVRNHPQVEALRLVCFVCAYFGDGLGFALKPKRRHMQACQCFHNCCWAGLPSV